MKLSFTGTLVLLGATASAWGSPINIQGSYTGAINGDAFTAVSTGWLDPEAGSADVSVDFSHIPAGYHFKLPASCWICFICCNGRLQCQGALNMFSVTGGNYVFQRTITYADGSQVTLTGTVSYNEVSNTLEYTVTWGGECTIPVSNIDDIEWPVEERFTQLGAGQIRSYGTAYVGLIGGGVTPITFDGTLTYSGSGTLPFDEVAYMVQTQTFTGAPDYILDMVVVPGDSYIVPQSSIPTVSEWGLIVFTLLVLTVATVALGRRRAAAA